MGRVSNGDTQVQNLLGAAALYGPPPISIAIGRQNKFGLGCILKVCICASVLFVSQFVTLYARDNQVAHAASLVSSSLDASEILAITVAGVGHWIAKLEEVARVDVDAFLA